MKALILKDLYVLKTQFKLLGAFVLIYGIFAAYMKNAGMLGGVVCVLAAMSPLSALAYDERAKWDKYALTMPVTRAKMVLSKYVLGLMLCGLAFLIYVLFCVLVLKEQASASLAAGAVLLFAALFYMAITFPLLFKLGVERGRIAMFLAVLIPAGLIGILPFATIHSGQNPELLKAQLMPFLTFAPVVLAVLFVLSMLLSVHIYKKRDL